MLTYAKACPRRHVGMARHCFCGVVASVVELRDIARRVEESICQSWFLRICRRPLKSASKCTGSTGAVEKNERWRRTLSIATLPARTVAAPSCRRSIFDWKSTANWFTTRLSAHGGTTPALPAAAQVAGNGFTSQSAASAQSAKSKPPGCRSCLTIGVPRRQFSEFTAGAPPVIATSTAANLRLASELAAHLLIV
jgi:hypothetical protein